LSQDQISLIGGRGLDIGFSLFATVQNTDRSVSRLKWVDITVIGHNILLGLMKMSLSFGIMVR